MASVHPCAGDRKARSQLAETSKASGRKTSRCSFTIESILGLGRSEETARIITPHRPWVDILNVTAFPGSSCPDSSERFCDRSITVKDGKGRDREMCCAEPAGQSEDRFSDRPNCCWFRGRRARTAFSRSQIEVLEKEFQLNCYPGIDVREELAQKLALDEDRIQIWFQNRRAKLKRSRRESQFLMVKNALISSGVQKQKVDSQL
ncbi:homeobox expressed in ES cells 1 [Cetorhinus maximus]